MSFHVGQRVVCVGGPPLKRHRLSVCERQVGKLLKEIAIEKAINEDDDIQHLERQAARLAEEIQARKAKRLNRNSEGAGR